jgi:hypothetical protein
MRWRAIVIVASLLDAVCARALDISTCGGEVPVAEEARLLTDLACSGDFAILLHNRATLDLDGHTITLVRSGGNQVAVQCVTDCTVIGGAALPGSIVGSGAPLVASTSGVAMRRGTVRNVQVSGFTYGIVADRRVEIEDVTVSDCRDFGVLARKGNVTTISVAAAGNGVGIQARRVTAVGLDVSGNAEGGLYARRVFAQQVTANSNGRWGIVGEHVVKIDGAAASGNGDVGVLSSRVLQVSGSDLTGNGVDVASYRQPRLSALTCASSRRLPPPSGYLDLDLLPAFETWAACPGE